MGGFIHPSAWKTRGEEVGAPSSPVYLSSCSEDPFFPAFCSSQTLSWCSTLGTSQRGLLGIQSQGRKSLLIPIPISRDFLPPSQPLPSAPFLGFHPKPAGFTPQLWLCVHAELGGFGIIPIPPGSSGTRQEQGKGPRAGRGSCRASGTPARVGKAGFEGFGSLSSSIPG